MFCSLTPTLVLGIQEWKHLLVRRQICARLYVEARRSCISHGGIRMEVPESTFVLQRPISPPKRDRKILSPRGRWISPAHPPIPIERH